jgi:tRNA-dihydrouridine synthase B
VNAAAVPVTLKIRTGTDSANRNGVKIARIAEASGIQLLTVHGRTRADRFKGAAEYDTIAQIVSEVSIPVIANGDIDSVSKARAVLASTGAAGIMLGRAAQGATLVTRRHCNRLSKRSYRGSDAIASATGRAPVPIAVWPG